MISKALKKLLDRDNIARARCADLSQKLRIVSVWENECLQNKYCDDVCLLYF